MKHRLFLAVDIPHDTATRIVDLQARLDQLALPIRWEPIEKLHLTTNFIGKVDEEKQNKIISIASAIISGRGPFTLAPVFLETMYRKHEGSYVYLGISGEVDLLKEIQRALADAISDMYIAQPDKFLPHITIGKLKKMDPEMTKDVLQTIREQDFDPLPPFTVDQISMYQSLLSQAGSHYSKVNKFTLN